MKKESIDTIAVAIEQAVPESFNTIKYHIEACAVI